MTPPLQKFSKNSSNMVEIVFPKCSLVNFVFLSFGQIFFTVTELQGYSASFFLRKKATKKRSYKATGCLPGPISDPELQSYRVTAPFFSAEKTQSFKETKLQSYKIANPSI